MIYTVNHALEGFTLKITDSPNMICMVYHATVDLLYSENYWLSKYGYYGQPCGGGFMVRIIDYPNVDNGW